MNDNEKIVDRIIKETVLIGFSYHEIEMAEKFAKEVSIKVAEEKDKKLKKMKNFADNMYSRMQNLSTDLSQLRKAMEEYHNFIIHEYYN